MNYLVFEVSYQGGHDMKKFTFVDLQKYLIEYIIINCDDECLEDELKELSFKELLDSVANKAYI